MNDGLGVGASIHGEMQRRLARGALCLIARLPIMIYLHQILGREKPERRVLPGNQESFLADSAAQVSSPTGDKPPLEKQLAPLDHFSLDLGHEEAPLAFLNISQGRISLSIGCTETPAGQIL